MDPKDKVKIDDESDSDGSLSLDLEFECEICDKCFYSVKSLVQHEKSRSHYKKLSQKKLEKKLEQNMEDEVNSGIEYMSLDQKPYAECDVCKKMFSGPESYSQHLKSKVHRKKVAKVKLLEQVTHEGKVDPEKLKDIYKQNTIRPVAFTEAGASGYSPTSEETESDDNDMAENHKFECVDCDKAFTGIEPWHQHLVSKVHEKTARQKKLLARVTCSAKSLQSKSESPEDSEVGTSATGHPLMDVIEVDGDVLVCRLCHMSFSGPESAAAHLKSRGHAKKKQLREFKLEVSAKRSIKKTKAQDLRKESHQVTVGQMSVKDLEGSVPASSNEIVKEVAIATDECSGKPTHTEDSTKKTKAQDFRNENQHLVDQPLNFEGKEHVCSKEISRDETVDKDGDFDDMNANQIADLGHSSAAMASKNAAVETQNCSNTQRENTLLCYEKYKNYKRIMNEIQAEKTD